MGIRNNGVLDSSLAGFAIASRMTDKIISFRVGGENPDVDTASIEDVWETGGRYDYLLAASSLTIGSTSADDALGGIGLETVLVTGLDANYDYQIVEYTLTGLTPVVSTELWLRVFTFSGNSESTTLLDTKAVGLITAKSGALTQAAIFAGSIAAKQAFITVIKGYSGFLTSAYTSGGANDDFIMRFASRKESGVFVSRNDIEITNSSFSAVNFWPPVGAFSEKTDLKVEAQAQGQNAQVRISYGVTMIKNDYLESLANSI